MEDLNAVNKRQHKMALTNRKNGTISGVTDVLSFDTGEILLETDMGMLMMKGKDLHVKRLNLEKGEVDIDGRVDSLTYSDGGHLTAKGESWLSKLFK